MRKKPDRKVVGAVCMSTQELRLHRRGSKQGDQLL